MTGYKLVCKVCSTPFLGQRRHSKYCCHGCYSLSLKAVKTRDNADQWFWSKVRRGAASDCWPWSGIINSNGYGRVTNALGRKQIYTHRAAYILSTGDESAQLIMHSCDNRICCNPDHLSAGTHKLNAMDAAAKGRTTGDRSHSAKLTAAQVRAIRRSTAMSVTLAERYSVHDSTICRIRSGETWPSRAATSS